MNRIRTSTNPQFGAWLESEMRAAGMNQVELAKYVGVSHVTVGRWIKGRVPNARYINALSLALDKTYDEVNEKAGYAPPESRECLEQVHRQIDPHILKIIDDDANLPMLENMVRSFVEGVIATRQPGQEARAPESRDDQGFPSKPVRAVSGQ